MWIWRAHSNSNNTQHGEMGSLRWPYPPTLCKGVAKWKPLLRIFLGLIPLQVINFSWTLAKWDSQICVSDRCLISDPQGLCLHSIIACSSEGLQTFSYMFHVRARGAWPDGGVGFHSSSYLYLQGFFFSPEGELFLDFDMLHVPAKDETFGPSVCFPKPSGVVVPWSRASSVPMN